MNWNVMLIVLVVFVIRMVDVLVVNWDIMEKCVLKFVEIVLVVIVWLGVKCVLWENGEMFVSIIVMLIVNWISVVKMMGCVIVKLVFMEFFVISFVIILVIVLYLFVKRLWVIVVEIVLMVGMVVNVVYNV